MHQHTHSQIPMKLIEKNMSGVLLLGQNSTPIGNAIRRFMMNKATFYSIGNVHITENDTPYPNEVLQQRIELIPLRIPPWKESIFKRNKILIEISKDNYSRDKDLAVTSNHFSFVKMTHDNRVKKANINKKQFFRACPLTKRFIHIVDIPSLDSYLPELPHVKLKGVKKDHASFRVQATIQRDNGEKHIKFSPVSVAFIKNRHGSNELHFESVGAYTPREIVKSTLEAIITSVDTLMSKSKITEEGVYTTGVDYGLLHLIRNKLVKKPDVLFCAIRKVHPLENKIVLKLELDSKCKRSVEKMLQHTLDQVKIDFVKLRLKMCDALRQQTPY